MKQILYQLLPRLWGRGKFSSIDTESLGYIRGLGVDTLWLTGVIRHATRKADGGCTPSPVVKGDAGSPYAITDYYDVNPYLADDPAKRMEEFLQVVERVHGAGLKLVIDFVPNHVARDYRSLAAPAGVRSLGEDDDTSVHWAPGNDFFYYPGQALQLPVDLPYQEFPAKASGNAFTAAPGMNDWWETVRLNYCDFYTPTWEKMYQIIRFWALKGVDGFRCDMVELVPPAFLQWMIARIKAEFPQIQFIAEVYEKERYAFYANEVGFDLLYDKSGLYDTLRAVTCSGASARAISWNWQFLGDDLQPRMLNFLENHDEQRVASDFFAGSPAAGYAALGVSLLLNTAPFMLYFGQEGGESGMQAEGFSGLDGRTSIFDWCTVPALQNPDPAVLARYRQALALARRPAFREGKTYDLCYCQGPGFNRDRHFAWLRCKGRQTFLLVANFGADEEITVHIPPEAQAYLGLHVSCDTYSLEVPGRDFAYLSLG